MVLIHRPGAQVCQEIRPGRPERQALLVTVRQHWVHRLFRDGFCDSASRGQNGPGAGQSKGNGAKATKKPGLRPAFVYENKVFVSLRCRCGAADIRHFTHTEHCVLHHQQAHHTPPPLFRQSPILVTARVGGSGVKEGFQTESDTATSAEDLLVGGNQGDV